MAQVPSTVLSSAPPAEVFEPFMLRGVLLWVRTLAPGLFRASVVATGRKREKLLPAPKSTSTTG